MKHGLRVLVYDSVFFIGRISHAGTNKIKHYVGLQREFMYYGKFLFILLKRFWYVVVSLLQYNNVGLIRETRTHRRTRVFVCVMC